LVHKHFRLLQPFLCLLHLTSLRPSVRPPRARTVQCLAVSRRGNNSTYWHSSCR